MTGKSKKLLFTIFSFGVLFYTSPVLAIPTVGVLSVKMEYPSKGFEWFELFLQEELSLQLQLSKKFSVISPKVLSNWSRRIIRTDMHSSTNDLKNTEISILNPDIIFRLSIQKVLNKLFVNWEITKFNQSKSIKNIKKIHDWSKPDELVSSLIKDIKRNEKLFSNIKHYPFNYSWDGIRNFYKWKQKPLPRVNSVSWIDHKNELESFFSIYPEISANVKYSRAVLNILEGSLTSPFYALSLNSAQNDIVSAMDSHPGNSDYHNLLSLVHFLRKEKFFAKQQANIANKLNHSNGLSLILYGLTIGKSAKAGGHHIRKGLKIYPFLGGNDADCCQPFDVLLKELEPWLISKSSSKTNNFKELMIAGKYYYDTKMWDKSIKVFKDASSIEPLLSEPKLYLARIKLAQKNLKTAKNMLVKLHKIFPKNNEINLYLGYANEKLKNHLEAESFYRKVLDQKPENYRALLRLGAVLIKLGKLEEARSFLLSLTQKHPDYSVGWWNLGIVYYQLGEIELAEISWEESLRLEPDNGQVRLILERLRDELSFKQFKNL